VPQRTLLRRAAHRALVFAYPDVHRAASFSPDPSARPASRCSPFLSPPSQTAPAVTRADETTLNAVTVVGNWLEAPNEEKVLEHPGARTIVDREAIVETGANNVRDVLRRAGRAGAGQQWHGRQRYLAERGRARADLAALPVRRS
jgi:hypothetical protein